MSTGKFRLSKFEQEFLHASSSNKPKLVLEAIARKEEIPQGFVRPVMEVFVIDRHYESAAKLAHYLGENDLAKNYGREQVYAFMDKGNLQEARTVAKSLMDLGIFTEFDFNELFAN